jgi:tetratricopeptide (TPR) repeat protein
MALAACGPYPRESKRMAEAFEQAQLVYGKGENDTLLFIPELDKASAYYAQKGDYGKAALAALYHGYAEKDYDKTLAMNAFKEAEQYGELVHDSLTVARAQYQMGRMLYGDYMHEESLSMFKKSDMNFGNHYGERALVMNAQACSYILLHDYDNADSCLSKSLFFAEQGDSNEAKQKALNNYAKLYQLQGEYGKAIECLRMVKTEDEQQTALNHLNLGNVFMAMGEMDSAAFYYQLMEASLTKPGVNAETKASAYASLSQFMEHKGEYKKASEYQKEETRYIVEVKDRVKKENVYRIQQQYDHETLRNEMIEKIITRQYVILFMGLVVVLVLVALVLSQKRLERLRKQEMETRERACHYLSQYYDLLKKQGKTMQQLAIVMDNKGDKALLDNLRATVFEKKEPWDAIMDVFDVLHPNERERIRRQYPELTEIEQKDVILSYFKVSRTDESLLLKTGIHTIDKIRTSVKKKTQIKEEMQ